MLFNSIGYYFIFPVLENWSTVKLDAAIDNGNYTEEGLFELKVPLNMPYQSRITGFVRCYGEVTVDGLVYTYVKMKIDGDMMVLKCIANHNKQQIKSSFDNLAKSNSSQDMENTGKKHNISFAKIFTGDFDDKNQFCVLPETDITNSLLGQNYTAALTDVLLKTPHQPPES
jgi:hypothetical protein